MKQSNGKRRETLKKNECEEKKIERVRGNKERTKARMANSQVGTHRESDTLHWSEHIVHFQPRVTQL